MSVFARCAKAFYILSDVLALVSKKARFFYLENSLYKLLNLVNRKEELKLFQF